MKKLTFALDVQLNDKEDWIAAGTEVTVYNHPIKKEDCTHVIIKEAFDFYGKKITVNTVECFMNYSFKELR